MAELPPYELARDDSPAYQRIHSENGAYVFRDECILGTRMNIICVADNYSIALNAAQDVRHEIDRLNTIFNTRNFNSEISQLNKSQRFYASPELFEVISLAEQWRTETQNVYSGRLGKLINIWTETKNTIPSKQTLASLAEKINQEKVILDASVKSVTRPETIKFSVDSLAKGWIIDRVYQIACTMPGIAGALIDIGGDIRCGGKSPDNTGWKIVLPNPTLRADNAPPVEMITLSEGAIATSGCGVRDLTIKNQHFSHTLSPANGWPIKNNISATVVAPSAAKADTLATALLVDYNQHIEKVLEKHNARARVTSKDNSVVFSPSTVSALSDDDASSNLPNQSHLFGNTDNSVELNNTTDINNTSKQWHANWQALATFTAPRRQLMRDPYFRSPYMAMWITDENNKPIRTLLLVGTYEGWQKDNFIWWSMNRGYNEQLISIRSMSTSGAGVYNVFWDGVDDEGKPVEAGKYVLHVETSRERGKHTYRSLTLDFSQAERFVDELTPTEEGGGLRVTFDHY